MQGALTSIKTLSTGLGALFFSLIYSISIKWQYPVPSLAFYLGSFFYFISYVYIRNVFKQYVNNVPLEIIQDDESLLMESI